MWWLSSVVITVIVIIIAGGLWVKRHLIRAWIDRNMEWLEESSNDISARATSVFVNLQACHSFRQHISLVDLSLWCQIVVLIQQNHVEIGGQHTPQPYDSFVGALGFLSLDFVELFPADCIAEAHWSHYDSLLLVTMLPIGLLLLLFAIACVRKATGVARRDEVKQQSGYFLAMMLLVLPSVSRRICQTFQCRESHLVSHCLSHGKPNLLTRFWPINAGIFDGGDDGEYSLLVNDMSTSCRTTIHSAYELFAWIMVLIL